MTTPHDWRSWCVHTWRSDGCLFLRSLPLDSSFESGSRASDSIRHDRRWTERGLRRLLTRAPHRQEREVTSPDERDAHFKICRSSLSPAIQLPSV